MVEIKHQIFKIYSNCSWLTKIFVKIRWEVFGRLEEVESFIPKTGKIVEIGCGHGIFSFLMALKSPKREIIGIDLLRNRIKIAQKSKDMYKKELNVTFKTGNINSVVIPACDVIVFVDVLCYFSFEKQFTLLKKCYHNLKKRGTLLIKDFNKYPLWKYILINLEEFVIISMRIIAGHTDWKKFFKWKLFIKSSSEMVNLLADLCFKVKKIDIHKKNYLPHIIYFCTKK